MPAWQEARARQIIETHRTDDGPTLVILQALQREFGFISEEAVVLVADALNLTRAEVHGIVSFYHDFRREPAGRHVLKLCRAEACQSLGGERLAAHGQSRLGVSWGGTTADGSVTLEPVFCLGLCASGPAALLDGRPLGRLDAGRLDRLLDEVAS
ncbi:MAG: formate dehydrogenase subunit gamma [Alphaproteobacteria bacterium]|nr:formate dehydrogenase subunit gamma [Alphaproteobacteria bacterium]MCW5744448.1 formate dehydrogenase subunit gamma [Alphaproteobacteria bacterium]